MTRMRYAQYLDRLVTAALADFVPVDQGVTISTESLERTGYFRHFAHHLCGVGGVPAEGFGQCIAEGHYSGAFAQTGAYLTPAACLNLYPALFDLGKSSQLCKVTSLARVFRNEGEYSRYRCQEFVVREFLLYGERERVLQEIETVSDAIRRSIVVKKGALTLVVASDSFVPLPIGKLLESNQRKAQVKREFVLDAVPIAIGSVNVHGDHFMKSHGVERPGFITACVGLGLTRVDAALDDGIIEIAGD